MRKLVWGAALGVTILVSPTAVMAEGFVGLNYTQLKQDDRFFGDDTFRTGELFARIGGHINRYITTEMRVGTTVSNKTEGGEEYRFNYHVGAYVELGYQFRFLRPYLLLGYTYGEEEATLFNNVRYEDETSTVKDVSYGVGLDVNLGERLGLNAEYTQYYDVGDVTFRGPSAGIFYKF